MRFRAWIPARSAARIAGSRAHRGSAGSAAPRAAWIGRARKAGRDEASPSEPRRPHPRVPSGALASGAAADVVITHGAVEALNITFAAAAAETRSRRVAIESPGYFMLAPIVEGLGLDVGHGGRTG